MAIIEEMEDVPIPNKLTLAWLLEHMSHIIKLVSNLWCQCVGMAKNSDLLLNGCCYKRENLSVFFFISEDFPFWNVCMLGY